MPNTLTSIFASSPSTEPVEAPHPNTGVYVTGTQLANGTWQVVHTGVSKTATPPTMSGRLKNFPAVTASVVAGSNVLNNVLATPAGTSATGTSASAINAAVSSAAYVTAYRLLASDTTAGTYTQIYQGATASFAHTGLTASQTKFYKWQYVGGGFYDDGPLSAAFSGVTQATASPLYQVLIDGDSLEGKGEGSGPGGDSSGGGDPYQIGEFGGLAQPRWSWQLKGLLSASYGDFPNYGKSGQTVAQMLTDYQNQIIPLRNAATYPTRQIVWIGGGINEFILATTRTPAQVYADKKTMTAAYHAAGFKVITSTLTATSFVPAGSTNAAVMSAVNAYNDLVRNGQADMGYDGLVDFAADSVLANLGSGSYRDGLHMSDSGNARKALVAKPVFEAVAVNGTLPFVPPVAATNVYEEDNALIYTGGVAWPLGGNTGKDSLDKMTYLQGADGFKAFSFNGTGFALGTSLFGFLIKYDVYVDDVFKATVTTQGSPDQSCADRYTLAGLTSGTHHVKVVGRASYTAFAWLDRITVTGTLQTYAGSTTMPA